jgi:NADP-dependent 3-hydroxy acid dehydrogenase YdfG
MKIAITGHTNGLGEELAKQLFAHEIVGLSRSTNTTIKNTSDIVSKVVGCDVFINNASVDFQQAHLLQEVFNKWKDTNKTIINICSRSKYPNLSKGYLYSASKAALSHIANNLRFLSDKKCRIIDINVGLLDSELPSLSFREAAEIIVWCLNQPEHIEIGEISFWHKTPYNLISKMKDELK